MIDMKRLNTGYKANEPTKFGLFHRLLTKEASAKLTNEYPVDGFEKQQRITRPGKLYSFSMLPLVEKGKLLNRPILQNTQWTNLVNELLDPTYTETLSRELSVDLTKTYINIGLYRFSNNDYVEPHIDREDKILTQLFYFNNCWSVDNGGFLQLLHTQNSDSYFFSLPPLSNYSVAIVRTNTAWHAVTPISESSTNARQTLQLEYYRR